jgi:hypothetical protein
MNTAILIVGGYFVGCSTLAIAVFAVAEWRYTCRERRRAARRLARMDADAAYEVRCPRLRLVQSDVVDERRGEVA